ncbi:MAG: Crp/Fnr family transcriptional regulator [Helicobacter sp.]|nr:Crp/Fnr family transcriptional regulator [Helicobacteraceae bacterium]MDY3113982.1 Crp/Fnr family transcriptional regulator [Helicobacter sp.]
MQELFKILQNIGYKRFYNKNEILFFEGEIPNKLCVILSGKVRIYKSKDSSEETLHYAQAPDFIAEMPSLLNKPYPATAICINDCEILEIPLSVFKKQCEQNAELTYCLIISLCQKIRILESHIANNALNLKDKLIAFLQEHKDKLDKLTQRQIATSLNTSPEALSRIIKTLKKDGILSTNKGKITLL